MSSDMWMDEHERIGEQYAAGEIDREEAVARMKSLGFDPHEIEEQITELDKDRDNA